jgi:hypothetical protein
LISLFFIISLIFEAVSIFAWRLLIILSLPLLLLG